MIKLGVTGSMGSGKSSVCVILKDLGYKVIDADKLSREVLKNHKSLIKNIKESFGQEFVNDKGELKRRELGEYVFKSHERKEALEAIILPYIKAEIDNFFHKCEKEGEYLCILDAPTLIESGFYKYVDKVLLVTAPVEIRIKRVKLRDDLTEEEIKNRMNSQMTEEEKMKYSDFIIENSSGLEYLKDNLNNIINELKGIKV